MIYSTFITLKPSYHQLCSSDIVSNEWIHYMFSIELNGNVTYAWNDYRMASMSHFQLLSMFCQQIRQTVNDSLQTFFQTPFLSSQVIPQHLFEFQVNSSIYNWQSQTLNKFLRTIKLFRAITHGNKLMDGGWSLDGRHLIKNDKNFIINMGNFSNCSCVLSSSCLMVMGIFDMDINSLEVLHTYFMVPNFVIGCFPIEGLLKSTLECFYNQSCMLEIDKYISNSLESSFKFSALNENLNLPNETVESIINRLMIDSWSSNVSFSSYYKICSPLSCTFTYMGRNDIFSVVITILGLYTGLSLGIKLFILIILRSIEKIINNLSFHGLRISIKNIFICNTGQKLIRRLHFIFLLITLCLIFIFSTFTLKSITIQINKPSLSTYERLSKQYSDSLQCSCSHISIPYQSFITIKPNFHHICSSHFVSNEWISYLYDNGDFRLSLEFTDYRFSAAGQFLLLTSFCQLSQETVNNTLSQLYTSDFTNVQVLSPSVLNQQIETMIKQFHSTASNLFLNSLNLIRETVGSDMIMSSWFTNWIFIRESVIHSDWSAHTTPVTYEACDCGSSWKCTQSSRGMMSGCYALEALLQTALQCFYDQDCIDSNGVFTSLNISLLQTSQFGLNATFQSLLNNLMVEEYQSNLSYEKYYNECSPLSCQYSNMISHDATEAIISLISLYGGLFIITNCLAVIIVKIYQRRIRRITPEGTEQNT